MADERNILRRYDPYETRSYDPRAEQPSDAEMFNLRTSKGADFARGLHSTSLGLRAGSIYRAADKLEVEGREQEADALRFEAQKLQQTAAETQNRVASHTEVENVGDAIDYLQGGFGQLLPTMGPPMAAGLAGAAIGSAVAGPFGIAPGIAAAVGGAGAASIPAFQMEAGEQASSQQADEYIRENTTAEERLREQNIKGVQNAALESLFPAVFGGRVVGRTARKIAGEAVRKGPLRRTLAVGRETGLEAGTELSQTLTGQASLSRLNPNRDTTHDYIEQIDSLILGALGGGGISLGTTVPGYLAEKAGQKAGEAGDVALRDTGRAVGELQLRLMEEQGDTGIDVPLKASFMVDGLPDEAVGEFEKLALQLQRVSTGYGADSKRARAVVKEARKFLEEQGAEVVRKEENILNNEDVGQRTYEELTLGGTQDEAVRYNESGMNELPDRDVVMQQTMGEGAYKARMRHVPNDETAQKDQLFRWVNQKFISPEAAEAAKFTPLDVWHEQVGSSDQDLINEAGDIVRDLEARAKAAKGRKTLQHQQDHQRLRDEIEAFTGQPDPVDKNKLSPLLRTRNINQIKTALGGYSVAAFPPGSVENVFTPQDADAQRKSWNTVTSKAEREALDASDGIWVKLKTGASRRILKQDVIKHAYNFYRNDLGEANTPTNALLAGIFADPRVVGVLDPQTATKKLKNGTPDMRTASVIDSVDYRNQNMRQTQALEDPRVRAALKLDPLERDPRKIRTATKESTEFEEGEVLPNMQEAVEAATTKPLLAGTEQEQDLNYEARGQIARLRNRGDRQEAQVTRSTMEHVAPEDVADPTAAANPVIRKLSAKQRKQLGGLTSKRKKLQKTLQNRKQASNPIKIGALVRDIAAADKAIAELNANPEELGLIPMEQLADRAKLRDTMVKLQELRKKATNPQWRRKLEGRIEAIDSALNRQGPITNITSEESFDPAQDKIKEREKAVAALRRAEETGDRDAIRAAERAIRRTYEETTGESLNTKAGLGREHPSNKERLRRGRAGEKADKTPLEAAKPNARPNDSLELSGQAVQNLRKKLGKPAARKPKAPPVRGRKPPAAKPAARKDLTPRRPKAPPVRGQQAPRTEFPAPKPGEKEMDYIARVVPQADELGFLGAAHVRRSELPANEQVVLDKVTFASLNWEQNQENIKSSKQDVIVGDLWAQDGVKIVSTNLQGVHGRGLAAQAKRKGFIKQGRNVDFDSSPQDAPVITIAVKGAAPETAKIKGRAFSEQTTGKNVELMKSELRKLIRHARANPDTNFYMPFIGLGFGEGNQAEIMPILEATVREPNIFLVSKDKATVDKYAETFKPGIRRDATSRNTTSKTRKKAEPENRNPLAKIPQEEIKVTKIISGGQIGADLGGLRGAEMLSLKTGGTMPKGFITAQGAARGRQIAEKYGMTEGEADPRVFPKRTMKNVDDADATIAFRYKRSPGTDKTIGYAQTGRWQYGKIETSYDGHRPVLVVTSMDQMEVAQQIREFVAKTGAKTLNIAGHRQIPQATADQFSEWIGQTLRDALKTPDFWGEQPAPGRVSTGMPDLRNDMYAVNAAVAAKVNRITSIPILETMLEAKQDKLRGAYKANFKEVLGAEIALIKDRIARLKKQNNIKPSKMANDILYGKMAKSLEKYGYKLVRNKGDIYIVDKDGKRVDPEKNDKLKKALDGMPLDLKFETLNEALKDPDMKKRKKAAEVWLIRAFGPEIVENMGWMLAREGPQKFIDAAKKAGKPQAAKGMEFMAGLAGFYDGYSDFLNLAIDSIDPLGNAFHEGMHKFVNTLGKVGSPQVYDRLVKAATAPHVMRQMEKMLADYPMAIEQMKQDPEEAVAYAFQFYAAGRIPGGPEFRLMNQSLFARVIESIKKMLGIMSQGRASEAVFDALFEGRVNRDGMEPLRKYQERSFKEYAKDVSTAIRESVPRVLSSPIIQLANQRNKDGDQIKAFKELADAWHSQPLKGKPSGLVYRKGQFEGQFRNRWHKILADNKATKEDMQKALLNMQSMKEPSSQLEKDLQHFFTQMYAYQFEQGENPTQVLKVVDDLTGKKEWVKPDKVKNYWPRIWDAEQILANEIEFREVMKEEGKLDDETITNFIDMLQATNGLEVGSELQQYRADFTPYNKAVNARVFDFINEGNASKFAQFQEQDMAKVMDRYIRQAVARREHSRVFEHNGAGVTKLLADAKKQGATDEQIAYAEKVVQGLEGRLGTDKVSDMQRELMVGAMSITNFAVLAMATLSSMVDPLGVLVRTGSLKSATKTFQSGFRQILADARKQKVPDQEITEYLGIIEEDMVQDMLNNMERGIYMNEKLRKMNKFFFKSIGLEQWTRGTRIGATRASIEYLKKYKNDAKRLAELDLKPGDVQEFEDRIKLKPEEFKTGEKITEADIEKSRKMQNAVYRMTEESILRPTAATRPLWASDMRFRLLGHLKSYTFTFHNQILRQTLERAKNAENRAQAALAFAPLLSYVPVMLAADMVRDMIQGDDRDRDLDETVYRAIQRSAILGMGTFLMDIEDDVSWGNMPTNTVLGPVIDNTLNLSGAVLNPDSSVLNAGAKMLPYNALWRKWGDEEP